jgi:fructan beta-fructosidase
MVIGFNTHSKQVFISRMQNSGKIDFSGDFTGMHTAPYHISEAGEIRLHAFIDLSSVELFVDHGALVMTELCFPESGFQTISMYRSHESVNLKEGNIYTLKSIW